MSGEWISPLNRSTAHINDTQVGQGRKICALTDIILERGRKSRVACASPEPHRWAPLEIVVLYSWILQSHKVSSKLDEKQKKNANTGSDFLLPPSLPNSLFDIGYLGEVKSTPNSPNLFFFYFSQLS